MTGSLAFRKNEPAIRAGNLPEKYTRLLPYIGGDSILEIGSAEGVLALQMAMTGKRVVALEKNSERHETALQLYGEWLARERNFVPPMFVNDEIGNRLDLLQGIDTLVAVRMVYYLRGQLDTVFSAVARMVPNVVLCGNKNRAERWRQGNPDPPLGDMNRYAAHEGMEALLERHGYQIVAEVREGDEIVVGHRG